MNKKYPMLFSPLTVRGITIKNRIEAAPVSVFDLATTPERHLSDKDIAFFRLRARNGVGIVTLGDCIVHPSGVDSGHLPSPKVMACNEDNLPFLALLADEIHRYGAIANIELNHAGMLSASAGFDAWGPSYINFNETKVIACLSEQAFNEDPIYREGVVIEMTEEMIEEVVEGFGISARNAQISGFEMVNIHAGHGWLVHQFLSPLTNHRTDRFGGSMENRARLLLMIIDRIRQYCGEEFLIEVRYSGTDYVEGGLTLADTVELSKLLDGKADFLQVSVGNFLYPETECLMMPGMLLKKGYNLYLHEEISKHIKQSHMVALGAVKDPSTMEAILESGTASLVAMARPLNADADFVRKIKEGRESEIRPCIRCNHCLSSYQTRIFTCAVNPMLHRPMDQLYPAPPAKSKRVLIAGGGVAGMEAAITAVNCGHSVILCESTEKLGGLLRYARKVPFKKDTEEYLDYMIHEVGRLPIDVRLNTRVTPELIEELAPDAVIAAIGGQAKVPAIPGAAELAHPIMALYDDEVELGERVAIIGGGLTGSEAALELAMKGHKVTLIHRHSDIAREANSMHKPALMMQFKKYADHITILRDTSCDEVKEHSVVCHDKDGAVFEVETDTVILALGLNALREEADRLYLAAEDGAIVGDCRKPRRIADAVREAHDAVMAL